MKVGICADVNPNLIDGSTIWLQSVALALDMIPNADVTILLRDTPDRSVLFEPFEGTGIRTLHPKSLTAEDIPTSFQMANAIEDWILSEEADLFIVRGSGIVEQLLQKSNSLRRRIWPYWLERPDVHEPAGDDLAFRIFENFPKIIVQSNAHKAMFETLYHIPAAKLFALPPMVPDLAWEINGNSGGRPTFVYSGKMDSAYNVENYVDLFGVLSDEKADYRLVVLGDKFNADPDDREFVQRMTAKLATSTWVDWRRGVGRLEALRQSVGASAALCVRQQIYDSSLEMSTKLIEFCALGVPPIVNRTIAHESFLGEDYPFFVNSTAEMRGVIETIASDPVRVAEVGKSCRNKARSYALSHHASRINRAIHRSSVSGKANRTAERTRLLVAGHDFKFIDALFPLIEADGRFDLRFDKWCGTKKHDQRITEKEAAAADVVFCEWCAGPAVWYSRNLDSQKRLVLRLHRFELTTDFPAQVNFDNVDRLIVVRSDVKRICVTEFGVAPEKIDVMPQFVDWEEFHRPKHSWATKTLGLVGINPFEIKRPDRAITLLERLLEDDDSWRLRVRSVMPWTLPWLWEKETERQLFAEFFEKITQKEELHSRILFDPPGPDMAEWYRNITFILSTSSVEGCHTAVAEGMASGAWPIIANWKGADTVYPSEFVADDIDQMVALARIFAEAGDERHREIAEWAKRFDLTHTAEHFIALLTCPDLDALTTVEHDVPYP